MLIDIGTSNPPFKVTQLKATEELKKRMGTRPVISRLIDAASVHSGIESRYVVIPDAENGSHENFYSKNGNPLEPDTRSRMIEFENWSRRLTKEAVEQVLLKNSINAGNIQRLITISCTGFFAPGIDYHLIKEFGIPMNVKRTNIGFMGCAASIIGFNSVLESINSTKDAELNTLLVAVELCSLHLQLEETRDNILANMIFADGCAAVLFSNSDNYKLTAKLELLFVDSILFDNSSELMGWKIGNTGFAMNLSSELPDIILNKAVPSLIKILESHGINSSDIDHWALHPGGRAILDSLQEGLNLSENEMYPSRTVLKNYGNMSSASILFVLKEILYGTERNIKKGDLCCAVAFGPGLTMEAALFRGI